MAADLLGNQAFMESLQKDVQDIQWTITDILSRIGPVSSTSWKFPDKQASNVDVDDLLDLYQCVEDDDVEDKQVAHIALYELLIDRLVFLIRSVSTYVNNLVCFGQEKHQDPLEGVGSVGLIMKHFWTQMISVQTHFKQLISENKSFSGKENGRESGKSVNTELPIDALDSNRLQTTACTDSLRTPGILGVIPPNTADMVLLGLSPERHEDAQPSSISKDTNNKSCQTYETSFVPCESCDVVQRKMKEAGDIVIKICTDQGLPCSLKKFKSQIAHVEWMSFNDVCRWMVEQNKDITRVGKHNEFLQSSINPMKTEVKSCQRRTSAAEEKAKLCESSLKEEKEVQTVLRRQIENKMKEQEKKHAENLSGEERVRESLKRAKEKLEIEMAEVKAVLEDQMATMKNLECDHRRMKQDLEIKDKEANRSSALSTEVAHLRVQISEITTKLEENSKLLAREQGKNRNASKHTQLLQSKQDSLLERMECLGRENKDLSSQVAVVEEEKIQLEDSIAELKNEAKELKQKARENEVIIKDLRKEKDELETAIGKADVSIRELKKDVEAGRERERMIVEYPDLNGPVNPDLKGSGDIFVDMDNQVTANTIRIRLLEEQNDSLGQSIAKIKQMHRTGGSMMHESAPTSVSVTPLPLWQQNSNTLSRYQSGIMQHYSTLPESECESSRQTSPSRVKVKQNMWVFGQTGGDTNPGQFVVSPSSNSRPTTTKQGRPPSGKMRSAMVPVNSTSIGAYTQMKRAGDACHSTREKDTHRKTREKR